MKEKEITKSVIKFYFESGDFNGYPVYRLKEEFGLSDVQAKRVMRNLIKSQKVDVVFGNIHHNSHIKAFSNTSREDQLKFLEELEFSEHFCLYPSSELLRSSPESKNFEHSPYTKQLALGAGQLDFRVFDLSVLEYYRNDPRYYYETNSIDGHISIRDEYFESASMPEHDQVLLESFGFAYDENFNRAVAIFLCYLSRLSKEHQNIWAAKELKDSYKLHPDYYRSSILGEWGTRIPVFEAFTQELELINKMATLMGRKSLFKESYIKNRPKEFGFLLRPTLAEFNSFVMLLDKMLSDNIQKNFFGSDLALEQEEERKDGKILIHSKGTITLLEEWVRSHFRPFDMEPLEQMFSALRKIRSLRQKPAHAVNENIFDMKYFKEQRQLLIEVYGAIRTLRLILANHPKVRQNPPEIDEYLFKGEIWVI